MANTSSIVSIHAYNVYAASTLSCLAQVTVLPRYLLKAEPAIAASFLKMPYHAIPQNALSSLKQVGLTNLVSVEAMNWSALTRATNITLNKWQRWPDNLRKAAEEYLQVPPTS